MKTNSIKNKFKFHNIGKIAVFASCKGGVGKSTITAQIAYTLAKKYKVGLLDADIYGPSQAKIFGTNTKPEIKNGLIEPITTHNLKLISMGQIAPEGKALIWRGPMITKTLIQFLQGANWGKLDYLFIDMPPGTGDVYLSLTENFHIDGAILISTPQLLSIEDTTRSIDCFRKTNVEIVGAIENLSFLKDKNGSKQYIFGEGLVKKMCLENNLKFIGQIPILPSLSSSSNIFQEPNDSIVYFDEISQKILDHL